MYKSIFKRIEEQQQRSRDLYFFAEDALTPRERREVVRILKEEVES